MLHGGVDVNGSKVWIDCRSSWGDMFHVSSMLLAQLIGISTCALCRSLESFYSHTASSALALIAVGICWLWLQGEPEVVKGIPACS